MRRSRRDPLGILRHAAPRGRRRAAVQLELQQPARPLRLLHRGPTHLCAKAATAASGPCTPSPCGPCKRGGQLELLSAPTLRGPWTQLVPMFTTNRTCEAGVCEDGGIEREFVTSGYFGGLAGDPDDGKTCVVTQVLNPASCTSCLCACC